MTKTLSKLEIEMYFLNLINDIYEKTTISIILSDILHDTLTTSTEHYARGPVYFNKA